MNEFFIAASLLPQLIQHLLILASEHFNLFFVSLSQVLLQLVVLASRFLLKIAKFLLRLSQQLPKVVHRSIATLSRIEQVRFQALNLCFKISNLMLKSRYFVVPFLHLVSKDLLILVYHNNALVADLKLFPHFLNLA